MLENGPELCGQLRGSGMPRIRSWRHGAFDRCDQTPGRIRLLACERRRRPSGGFLLQFLERSSLEGWMSGERPSQTHPERIEIRTRGGWLPREKFRRHEERR